MASRLTLRVQERLARLTPGEGKLGRLILDAPDLIERHSATELARMAGVSKATAARFFRSLGYADFGEVKRQAREERDRTEPYHLSVARSDAVANGRTVAEHLDLELANLTRTFEEMRSDRLTEAAELIGEAPTVWFLGLGLEEGLARHARLLFSRQRPDVRQLGTRDGEWAEALAMTGAGDALVLFALPPRPRTLRRIVDYARTSRMNIVTLTDHAYLPRARRFSRVVLPCHVTGFGRSPSHTALCSVLRLLSITCLARSGHAARQRMDIIDEIHEELDDLE